MIKPIENGFNEEGEIVITGFEFLGYTFEVDPENERFNNLDLPGEFITFAQFELLKNRYEVINKTAKTEPHIRDSEAAFENAIKQGLNPDKQMYMYSHEGYDYFKHYDTRKYTKYKY